MPLRPLLPSLLWLSAALVPAMEVVGKVPYLETTLRAEWRSELLAKVVSDIGRQIGTPVALSPGVERIRDTRQVTLVDPARTRLGDTLERLERSQDLHITAEALTLRIETWEDFRDRKRHPVNLALRDYGMFLGIQDFPGPVLGFGVASGGNRKIFVIETDRKMDHDHAAGRGPESHEVVDWLRTIASDTGVELRGNGNAYVLVTDEEETAIRQALQELQSRTLRRTAWRVRFGTLPAGEKLPTGLISTAAASALGTRLGTPRTLTLSAMNGQRVHALSGIQQSLIDDLEIVNHQFDPSPAVFLTGCAADLRPTMGALFTRVAYHLSWVDPLPSTTVEVTNPARAVATENRTTVKNGKDKEAERETTLSVSSAANDHRPGVTVAINRPVVWSWMPRGDVLLDQDQALVLATEHPAGTAVMILEPLP